MGISYNEFWMLTPRKLNVIIDGYKLKKQLRDEEQWILGGYISYAVRIAIVNAFKKKNEKDINYFETIEKPFFKESKLEMTDEEKQKKLDMLMASLHVMKNNFELNHGK